MDTNAMVGMLEALSDAKGAPGFEEQAVAVAEGYARALELGAVRKDTLHNLYIRPQSNTGKRPVVMLDAHTDEVAFMVHSILANGMIRFVPLGGWVSYAVPAHRVWVRTRTGAYIPGVVAAKPVHYMTEAEKSAPLTMDAMVIDVGATSREEAVNDYGVRIGEPIVPDVKFEFDERHGTFLGKAFDCRIGCAAVLATLDALKGEALDVDVVGALSVQEEVGTRGAKVTVNAVKPDVAIVFEGCPADDSFVAADQIQTGLKRGPMLRHIDRSMITHPAFQRFALDLAAQEGIPVQEAVRTGGSTNGASIHLSEQGIPVIVVGLPVRYAHSHYCYSALSDLENAVRLAKTVLKHLNEGVIRGWEGND